MGFRFRKSIKLLPGVRLNLSNRSTSVSVGGRGGRVNLSRRGTRLTTSLPGSGLSWTKFFPHRRVPTQRPQHTAPFTPNPGWPRWLWLVGLGLLALVGWLR
jgi:hypothetical protein